MSRPVALVTGAPGWLGTRLVRLIAAGIPNVPAMKDASPDRIIRCLVLPGQDISVLKDIPGRVECVAGDLTDPQSLPRFVEGAKDATLFHCAGVIHPTNGVRQLYAVNVDGTRNLIEAAQRFGVKRFIHVSSNSPMGCNPSRDHRFDESSPYNPYMNYGKSKKLAEDVVNGAGRSGNIETVIIRPPWFYGPDQPPRQTLFFKMIQVGKFPLVGNGENRRSMAYVDNICQGLMLCERVETARGQTFWISDRRAYTLNDIVDTIARVMEKDFEIAVAHKQIELPGIVSEIALFLDRIIQGLGAYHQKLHVLSEMNKNIACSIEKAEKQLGYDPKIELEEGMRRSLEWMLERGIAL